MHIYDIYATVALGNVCHGVNVLIVEVLRKRFEPTVYMLIILINHTFKTKFKVFF
jgi:hypothetical protein